MERHRCHVQDEKEIPEICPALFCAKVHMFMISLRKYIYASQPLLRCVFLGLILDISSGRQNNQNTKKKQRFVAFLM